jgi:hypothetical protein
VTPWGILPARAVIFVKVQQLVIKVNAGALPRPSNKAEYPDKALAVNCLFRQKTVWYNKQGYYSASNGRLFGYANPVLIPQEKKAQQTAVMAVPEGKKKAPPCL